MPESRDHELEQYLDGRSELSRLYRETARERSSPALDEKILQAARRELHPRRAHWMMPLSAAAVLVLAFTLLLRVQHEEAVPLPAEAPMDATPFDTQPEATTVAPIREYKAAPAAQPAIPPEVPRSRQVAPLSREEPHPAATDAMPQAETPDAAESPDEWIAWIRQLRDAGRDAEADEALARFRAQHPDHPLPEDLTPTLPSPASGGGKGGG